MDKKCGKCGQVKDIKFFSIDNQKRDGLHSSCKQCAYNCYKEWIQTEDGKSSRKNSYKKNYITISENFKNYKINNREKITAHMAVNSAVRSGKIPNAKTLPCACCGNTAREYHHHRGYNKENRLNVIPVCRNCHRAIEGK